MNGSFSNQIETWNRWIREGLGQRVAQQLRQLSREQVPKEHLSAIANLSWRVNQPKVGLRLLYPFMRASHDLRTDLNPEIVLEYACCLLEIGATAESKLMIDSIRTQAPRGRFFEALLCFKEWNYAAAIPLLEGYLTSLENGYHRSVVQVNLAAAYVTTGDYAKAETVLHELRSKLDVEAHRLLLGNVFEISAQISFKLRRYEEALKLLERGESLLSETRNMGWLYCKKWQFLCRLASAPAEDCADQYHHWRKTATEMSSWETLRELDLHWALFRKDLRLLTHVYFGSPLHAYRKIVTDLGAAHGMDPTQAEFYLLGAEDRPKDLTDLVFAEDEALRAWLPKKLLLHLISDFYAPFRTGQLFSLLFDGEHYNPDTAPERVFQLARRLRAELGGELDADIISFNDGYQCRLAPGEGVRIGRIWTELVPFEKLSVIKARLDHAFAANAFSNQQMSNLLRVNIRTGNRIIKELCDSGHLTKSGAGKATRYKAA